MTTLADLKRAIDRIGPRPTEKDDDLTWKHFHYHRAEAWSMAFYWKCNIGDVNRDCKCKWCIQECNEHDEGMALIMEKLK